MTTCKTCKHWTELPPNHPQAERKGLCRGLCIVPRDEWRVIVPAALPTLGHIHPTTLAVFGCPLHKARHD